MKPKKAKKKRKATFVFGFDLSPSSISGGAKAYDPLTGRTYGPVWASTRWNKVDHSHWDKLKVVANASEFIFELQNELGAGGLIRDLERTHIGVEQLPANTKNANRYREQAEINGAFIGGLLRWGYPHVYDIHVKTWQAYIAPDFGLTAKDWDKFKTKEWAIEVFDLPDLPDLIYNAKLGLIPQPETSKAKPNQPNDIYDAVAITEYLWSRVT